MGSCNDFQCIDLLVSISSLVHCCLVTCKLVSSSLSLKSSWRAFGIASYHLVFFSLFLQLYTFFCNPSPYKTRISFSVCFHLIKQCIASFNTLISPSFTQLQSLTFVWTGSISILCMLWQYCTIWVTFPTSFTRQDLYHNSSYRSLSINPNCSPKLLIIQMLHCWWL